MDRPIIMTLGLSDDEVKSIRATGLAFDLFETDCHTDAIAHYADLTIIDRAAITEEEAGNLVAFYEEIDPCSEEVIVVGNDSSFERISFVECIPDFFKEGFDRSIAIMRKLKESKRDVDYSRRIADAVRILKMIEETPGITTQKLSEATERSPRTVKRYIASLQAVPFLIAYRNKGWYCLLDPREMV